ncbi:TcpE family conjugal transfer membrane protein [Leuconostoc citreum]|uniref:TcpE family conjugal transfer membrane protein n=1 Tax=Leuconostoc citreum TaxID=33964 RepID=UPI0032DF1925
MAAVYNYQKALKQDIVIRKIDANHSLPVGISLRPAVIFIVAFVGVYMLFHVPLAAFYRANSDLGKLVYVLFYGGLPMGLVMLANKVKPDGLGLVAYSLSMIRYGFKLLLNRTSYYHDQVLPQGYFEASQMADTAIIILKKSIEKELG